MKISPDTKDSVLFFGGCLGMFVFGMVMPLFGYGFNLALFSSWSLVAGVGVLAGVDTRRKTSNGDNKENFGNNDNA